MTQDNKYQIHIIAGPTASGKSARALELANELDGVIINCDSMQIYDGLQTLTAQPPESDLSQAQHLLYSHLHPNDTCSAGNWSEMVKPVITEVIESGKTPIIVGGSGLYIKALTEGLSPMPDVPQDIRDAAVKKQQELGNPAFHAELEKRDPIIAQRFHPFHTARLVRAWEVLEATGKSLAEWQNLERVSPPENWDFQIEVIIPERAVQHQRCNDRFLWMMDNGILEEVEEFSQRIDSGEVRDNVALVKSLGYRPLLSYIKGEISKDDAIEQSQARTRQYAKQQCTWFRNQLKTK